MKTHGAPPLQVSIDRIRVEGAPAALRDTATFSRILDRALSRAFGTVAAEDAPNRELGIVKVRVAQDAGGDQIAGALAEAIARAARGG